MPQGNRKELLQFKFRNVADAPEGECRIAGVANNAGVTDSYGTRIRFDDAALREFMQNPVMLFNHNPDAPCGTFTKIEYRGEELYVEGVVSPNAMTPYGARVADLVADGTLRAFSVRFGNSEPPKRMSDHYQINADELVETSIVTLPSNKPSLFQQRMMHPGEVIHDSGEEKLASFVAQDHRTEDARAVELDWINLMQRLGIAVYESSWDDYRSLLAVYDDYLVFTSWSDGRFYKVSWALDGTEVSLGDDIQEVIATWEVVGGEPVTLDRSAEVTVSTEQVFEEIAMLRQDFTRLLDRLLPGKARAAEDIATSGLTREEMAIVAAELGGEREVEITPDLLDQDVESLPLDKLRTILRSD